MTEFPIPTAKSGATEIAAGPDGALWFTEQSANKIGRIGTTRIVTEFPVPTANSGPTGITAGPDGALWFGENTANQIGRITTTGIVTDEIPIPTGGGGPYAIAKGPDGNVWFTEINGDKIGRVNLAAAPTCPSGEVGTPPNCTSPPSDDSGGGPPAAMCPDHVVHVLAFTVSASCFTHPKDLPLVWVATGRVRLSGIDIDPGATGKVTIDLKALTFKATGQISVSLGRFRVFHRSGSWQLDLKKHLMIDVAGDAKIKGLPISGKLDIAPAPPDAVDVTAQAGIGFLHLTGDVMLHLSDQTGLTVNKLDIVVGNVPLGPLASIKGGSLKYSRTSGGHDKWSAMVTIMLPPKLPTLQGALEIVDGKLSDIAVSASGLNLPIGEIVVLQKLGLDVRLVPNLDVTGSMGLSAGPMVLNHTALSIDASLEANFGTPVVFTVKGSLKVADKVELGNATARWAFPNQFSANAHIGTDLGPSYLHVHASADVSVNVNRKGFAVKGLGDISVGPPHGQGLVYLSEKGIVALAYASGPTVLGVTIAPVCAGAGIHWNGQIEMYADDGCSGAMSFNSAGGFASDARAASSRAFPVRVARGLTQVELGATAASGFPSFTLRSPRGQVIGGPPGTIGVLGHGTYLVVQDPVRHGTYVLIARPQAGTWTLTPTAGSVSIATFAHAVSPPPLRVATTVRRHGNTETLRWRASGNMGAALRFGDVGPFGETTILTTARPSGSHTFRSIDDAVGGRHHIEIVVTRNGLPQAVITGGSFNVPRPPAPPRPPSLRLRRIGSRVLLTWGPVPRAARYAVFVTTTDGRHKYFDQPANRRRVTLSRVFAPDTVTAAVQTVAADGLQSRPSRVKLRLTRKR